MRPDPRGGFRVTPHMVLGLGIVLVGLTFLADNLHWAEARQFLRYWPVIIIAVGLTKLLQAGDRSGRVSGGLVVLVGVGLTADFVYGFPIEIDNWWPIVLVALGVLIIVRASGSLSSDTAAPAGADHRFSEVAIWAGKQRRVVSPTFRKADLTAIMGGIELDLRPAGTATGEAIIDVFVMWGGLEIWVPPDWAVSNEVVLLMGGAEDKSVGTQAARHRLIIRGVVIMGGLEIKT